MKSLKQPMRRFPFRIQFALASPSLRRVLTLAAKMREAMLAALVTMKTTRGKWKHSLTFKTTPRLEWHAFTLFRIIGAATSFISPNE